MTSPSLLTNRRIRRSKSCHDSSPSGNVCPRVSTGGLGLEPSGGSRSQEGAVLVTIAHPVLIHSVNFGHCFKYSSRVNHSRNNSKGSVEFLCSEGGTSPLHSKH